MMADEEILAKMLYKLFNRGCFKDGHLSEENTISCVEKSIRGIAKGILKRAVNNRFILIYGQTEHGLAYQLNIERINEIKELNLSEHLNIFVNFFMRYETA